MITQEVGLAWRTLTMEERDSYVVLQISFADMNQRYAEVQKYKVNYRKTNKKFLFTTKYMIILQ